MISINFHGPYSEDLANAGAFDLDMQGYELIVVGKGVTKAQAANDAVSEFSHTPLAEYLQDVHDTVNSTLPLSALEVEADGVTHHVFCVIRFTP